MDVIVGLAVTSLVVLFLIHSTQSNYNIVDKFVDSTQGVRFRVKTQKYKKIPNKYLRQEEVSSWHFLTPEALEMTLPQCGRTCLETTDCTGFFFFKSETKSCFMNENAISLNKLEVKDNIDFYEIENECTRPVEDPCEPHICVPHYKNNSYSCLEPEISTTTVEPANLWAKRKRKRK